MKAKFNLHGQEIVADVVNPCQWFSRKFWCVEVGCGFSSFFYVVEADCEQDTIDTFVDSRFGRLVIVSDPDMVWLCPRDDGHTLGEDKVCLDCGEQGCEYPDPDIYSMEGNAGETCDLENMRIYEVDPTYFGPGLPEEGIDPYTLYRSCLEDEEVLPYWQSHLTALSVLRETYTKLSTEPMSEEAWRKRRDELGLAQTGVYDLATFQQACAKKIEEIDKYLEDI